MLSASRKVPLSPLASPPRRIRPALRHVAGWLLLAGLLCGAGCAEGNSAQEDPCKRALQRLVDECNFTIDGIDSLETYCTGQSACVATCLQESPCADIRSTSGEFKDCINSC